MNIRNLESQIKRFSNKVSCYINRLKLFIYNVQYGKNCTIHGHFGLTLAPNSHFQIGNNLYISSGKHINPLSCKKEAHISLNNNAILKIGNNVSMSSPVIWAHKSIEIGNYVMFGANVIIMDSDAHSLNYLHRKNNSIDMQNKRDAKIIIEDDVFIGMNSIIMKGVTIGARSVIGAGSVVTKSIPADCIACGNPATIIKHFK